MRPDADENGCITAPHQWGRAIRTSRADTEPGKNEAGLLSERTQFPIGQRADAIAHILVEVASDGQWPLCLGGRNEPTRQRGPDARICRGHAYCRTNASARRRDFRHFQLRRFRPRSWRGPTKSRLGRPRAELDDNYFVRNSSGCCRNRSFDTDGSTIEHEPSPHRKEELANASDHHCCKNIELEW